MVAKSARFLAPIALAAVAVGTYLIVHSSLATHHPAVVQQSSAGQKRRTRSARSTPRPKFYIVRANDTLSAISVKTHIAIPQLMSLNPSVSPNSLQTGQRLRLRR